MGAKAGGGSSREREKTEELATLGTQARNHAGEMKTIKDQQQQRAKKHTREMKTTKDLLQKQQ